MLKVWILAATVLVGHTASALDKNLAAELYVRAMVRASARLANGSDDATARKLCSSIPANLAVSSMAKGIAGAAWDKTPGKQKEFTKRLTMFFASNVVERLNPGTTVTSASAAPAGKGYVVAAKVSGGYSTKYWLAAKGGLNSLTDADLQNFSEEFSGQRSAGSSGVEAKIKNAFVIYTFQAKGREVVGYLKSDYARWAATQKFPAQLKPEYFVKVQDTPNACP